MSRAEAVEYPPERGRREPGDGIFSLRFMRVMQRARVASDVTALGRMLLTVIVLKEDDLGYSRAPTFWDPQLQEELGGITQKTLAAVRRKCVEAEWLHYENGCKGRAGRYFVTVPKWAIELNGSHAPESFAVNITSNNPSAFEVKNTENHTAQPDATENLPRIGDESGTKTEQIGNETGSFLPSSLSSSSSKELHTPHREGHGVFFTGPSAACRTFQERYPRKTSPTKSWETWQSVVISLVGERGWTDQQAEEFLIERATAFANSPSGQNPPAGQSDDFRPAPAKWLADGRYDEPESEWQKPNFRAVTGNATGRRRTPASEAVRPRPGATDFDALFDAVAAARHPADPEALAVNVAVRTANESSAVGALEVALGADLDRMTDNQLQELCTAIPSQDSRPLRDAKQSGRSTLSEYGRSDPRTRAALLKVLEIDRRRKVVA